MNTPKWIPKHSTEVIQLFEQSRQLEREFRIIGKKFSTDINLELPNYYEFAQLLSKSKKCFELSKQLQNNLAKQSAASLGKKLERSPYKLMHFKRATLCRQNLRRRNFQMMFIIYEMIKIMMGRSLYPDVMVDSALVLCSLYNATVELAKQNTTASQSGAQVCSNTFPTVLFPAKLFDIGKILQAITKQRSEQCCASLISCLLSTCKPEFNSNSESDTSSVEILKALTTHLSTSPMQKQRSLNMSPSGIKNESTGYHNRSDGNRPNTATNTEVSEGHDSLICTDSESNDSAVKFFDRMASKGIPDDGKVYQLNELSGLEMLEQLIANEENYIASILLKCIKLCPSAFDKSPTKKEIIKWVNRGTRGLWTQVGTTLEHVVLWWSAAPLACRPANCAKYLRDWLLLIQPDDAPEPILSTLKGLGETLTIYVSGTIWDKQFRLTLVSSALPINHNFENTEFRCTEDRKDGTTTGRLWSELLYTLTTFCNSCDQNGTIPNELPIVEQIPVLHRLDHSIHTARLWAADQAKALCTNWNMKLFFQVVNTDVTHCLEQLQGLRVPEMVPTNPTEVLVQVCVALRAKLVSEIKVNINKLKQTYSKCIEVLSSICRTISLATLSLCFPEARLWQRNHLQETANSYVTYFLDQLYLPVIQATSVLEILSLILKILCEAWLDHIYMKRIKFSRNGAKNLLKDFDGVAEWILTCKDILPEHANVLAKHEVLKMCEGVGKILLRKPDEVIPMASAQMTTISASRESNVDKAPLPPEMFVPNQQRWLELRARNRKALNLCICGSI